MPSSSVDDDQASPVTKAGPDNNVLQRCHSITEKAAAGIWFIDGLDATTFINDFGARVLGRAPEEMLGRRVQDILVPDDLPAAERTLRELRRGTPAEILLRFRHGQGHDVWIGLNASPLFNAHGEYEGTVGVFMDATPHHAAVVALRQQDEWVKIALQNSPTTVFAQDLELRYAWVYNPIKGFEDEHSLGRTDEEILGKEFAAPLRALKENVLSTGTRQRKVVAFPVVSELRWFDFSVESRKNSKGQLDGVLCVATDVTEAIRREHKLRTTEKRLRLFVEGASECIGILDADSTIVCMSKSGASLLGYTPDEIAGMRADQSILVHTDLESARPALNDLRTQRKTTARVMLRARRKNGSVIWLEVEGSIMIVEGKEEGYLVKFSGLSI